MSRVRVMVPGTPNKALITRVYVLTAILKPVTSPKALTLSIAAIPPSADSSAEVKNLPLLSIASRTAETPIRITDATAISIAIHAFLSPLFY